MDKREGVKTFLGLRLSKESAIGLLCKSEDHSSDPQHPHRKLGLAGHTSNSSVWKAKTAESLGFAGQPVWL